MLGWEDWGVTFTGMIMRLQFIVVIEIARQITDDYFDNELVV